MTVYSNYHLRLQSSRQQPGMTAEVYQLLTDDTLIGRDTSCAIVLEDRTVSDKHAVVSYDAAMDGFTLRDLNSTTGTYRNDEAIPPGIAFPLTIGDKLQIGEYLLFYEEHYPLGPSQAVREIARAKPLPQRRWEWYEGVVPPGTERFSRLFLPYLPAIYQPETPWSPEAETRLQAPPESFLSRFLALFESIYLPLDALLANFDFYLDPRTTPVEFFPWLEFWYDLSFAQSLSEERRRKLLLNAHKLFELKGTPAGLVKLITLCTDHEPVIDDQSTPGYSFVVTLKTVPTPAERKLIMELITAFKPAHTIFELKPSA